VRTSEPVREQGIFRWEMPEDALPEDHGARLLWRVRSYQIKRSES
jgi:hypothetical protein